MPSLCVFLGGSRCLSRYTPPSSHGPIPAPNGIVLSFFMAEYYSLSACLSLYIHIHHIFFNQSPVDGHLGCFHALAINNAAVNTGMDVTFRLRVFIFSSYVPRSEIPESNMHYSLFNLIGIYYHFLITFVKTKNNSRLDFNVCQFPIFPSWLISSCQHYITECGVGSSI